MRSILVLSLCTGLALAAAARADDAQPAPDQRNYARNLDNPTGIVIQPETGHVFVAERRGIVRFSPRPEGDANAQPGRRGRVRTMEITGYPTDVYGKGPMYDIGPLGVVFQNPTTLIVGDGSRPDGQELVRVYNVSLTPAERPAQEGSAATTLGPIKPGEQSVMGEGNFYGVALTKDALFVTCNGDDTKGWIARSEIKDGKFGPLTPYIATKEFLGVDAPVGITVNSAGDLVVSQMGEINVPHDSLLTVYDPKTGQLKSKYETGLYDIAGLAYSPSTGKLYAVDFAWMSPAEGGLFELTVSGDKCTARKVMPLDKPTAIAFDPQGNAYVTAFGTAVEGEMTKPGFVVRIPRNRL